MLSKPFNAAPMTRSLGQGSQESGVDPIGHECQESRPHPGIAVALPHTAKAQAPH